MNNTQHDNNEPEQTEPDLDAALEALQAVVMAQKAQIDALLTSLEGLLTALDVPKSAVSPLSPLPPLSPPPVSEMVSAYPSPAPKAEIYADSGLLGNPQDPQFASLHQLMGRLKVS